MHKFHTRLKELREDGNVTRKELAEIASVTPRSIAHWENGDRECDFNTLLLLANFFDVSTDYLLGRSDY